ncbi:uncharacterized protein LOC100275354 [Zea mays]|uniref:C2C2-GATA transcription factor n=1 Tax=Zea mays TaxID=4577 RepID=K7TMG0_MAIZE
MLHQTTLIPPSVSAASSSPFLHAATTAPAPGGGSCTPAFLRGASAMPSYAHHRSSPLDDGRMDALKCNNSVLPEETTADAAGAFVEKDGFSVEDLLDLEEFAEPDKDVAEREDDDAPPAAAAAAERSKADSQPSSVVKYDLPPLLPPPPEMVDLPSHDVEELEWVSRIMDDSLSELQPQAQPKPAAAVVASSAARPPLAQQRRPFAHDGTYRAVAAAPPQAGPQRTPTICALSTEAMIPVKAKRSKRSRGPGWSRPGASFLPDSASSSSTTTTSSCSSSGSISPFLRLDSSPFGGGLELGEGLFSYGHLLPRPPSKKSKHGGKGSKHRPKKRGRKPKHLPPPHPSAAASQPGPSDRRCSHCGVQKTPQWRAGPEGAKTLCNACGVRYKSGRLLPEYRPACSPTFVSSIHSNSHRKVLEMRRKKEGGMVATAAPAVASF